jgi:hypothetical protein
MQTLLLYTVLSAALFYLGSRAKITAALWSRYPPRFASFMDCAACSGTWYGFGLAVTLGRYQELDVLGLSSDSWLTPLVVAGCMMVLAPVAAAIMHYALIVLGSAVSDEE